MKVVLNKCYGGFGLSRDAYDHMGIEWDGHGIYGSGYEDRTDPKLVAAVEALGSKANGSYANLAIVNIPDDIEWFIDDYDGIETLHEMHRSW
jgi:hypothetical protein